VRARLGHTRIPQRATINPKSRFRFIRYLLGL
jgi:hypothetical protein